jgi:ubiquitin-protein ligase
MSSVHSETNNKVLYSKDTLKRIVSDIKQIKKNPLDTEGIYYDHDEENILTGYALIIGSVDTPYAYGNYFFKISYPTDYPHSPPIVTFINWGDNIRFNPNLYRNGKVCLSLLNTWRGEGWTSCQTLSTVLLTLCTILNENPLLNEPGITMSQEIAVNNYNEIISFKNLELAILKCNSKFNDVVPPEFHTFYNNVKENFNKNKEDIEKTLNARVITHDQKVITAHYNMNVKVNYEKLKRDFKELF